MRGRAIRTFKLDENKTANIWHLVTLEPETQEETHKAENTQAETIFKPTVSDTKDKEKTVEATNNTTHSTSTANVECTEETSSDYKTLKRRFNCFVGPHYTERSIESGIERISILKDSYTKETVANVNTAMEEMARNRQELADKWNVGNKSGIMYMKASIPKVLSPIKLGIMNIFVPTLILAMLYIATSFVIPNMLTSIFFKFIIY